MPTIDLILIAIVAVFGLFGLWFGLIHTLGSLIGSALGVYLATRYYVPLAAWLGNITGWTGNFPKVVMFIIAFVIINRLVGLLFFIVDKFFGIITHLPFISGINRLFGLIFGIFEGVVVLGIALYFIDKFPLSQSFMNMLSTSKIAPTCIHIASVLQPLIPQALRVLEDTIKNWL